MPEVGKRLKPDFQSQMFAFQSKTERYKDI